MDDIRRQDLRLFLKEWFAPGRLVGSGIFAFIVFIYAAGMSSIGPGWPTFAYFVWLIIAGIHTAASWSASVKKRFQSKRFLALWNGCEDRLKRFDEVLGKLRREQVAELSEMPRTIRRVAESLYQALRRSDMIAHEVQSSEHGLYAGPPVWHAPTQDPQSKELYRIADKNIAEYKQRFDAVMAGVQRTEAQSAVYMTTLDTLRMKMLGYRLVARSPEMPSQDFLEALTEAKMQLNAIDTALEELDLGPYPTMIAAMPPPTSIDLQTPGATAGDTHRHLNQP